MFSKKGTYSEKIIHRTDPAQEDTHTKGCLIRMRASSPTQAASHHSARKLRQSQAHSHQSPQADRMTSCPSPLRSPARPYGAGDRDGEGQEAAPSPRVSPARQPRRSEPAITKVRGWCLGVMGPALRQPVRRSQVLGSAAGLRRFFKGCACCWSSKGNQGAVLKVSSLEPSARPPCLKMLAST